MNRMFIGTEVEHTAYHGVKTLFIVGIPPATSLIEKICKNECINHVYFGANHSFNAYTKKQILDAAYAIHFKYAVTIDFDISYYSYIFEHFQFFIKENIHLNVSCKLPHLNTFSSISIKADDDILNKTNSGVWTMQLSERSPNFTAWKEYEDDKEVDRSLYTT